MKTFIEFLGWYGAVVILLAYALISFKVLSPTDFIYQLMNGTGALGLAIEALEQKDYQPGVLNVIWTIIAVIAMIQLF